MRAWYELDGDRVWCCFADIGLYLDQVKEARLQGLKKKYQFVALSFCEFNHAYVNSKILIRVVSFYLGNIIPMYPLNISGSFGDPFQYQLPI